MKARYATSDENKRAVLVRNGVPDALSRPPRVADCVTTLTGQMPWARDQYKLLCDWVHTNLGSQTVSTVGGRTASMLAHESGGMLFLPQATMINVHKYEPEATIGPVLAATTRHARENFLDAVEALKTMTQTPFTREELIQLTGSEYGVQVIAPHGQDATSQKTTAKWRPQLESWKTPEGHTAACPSLSLRSIAPDQANLSGQSASGRRSGHVS